MQNNWFTMSAGEGPICAVAVHDGHNLRDAIAQLTALKPENRKREEDPFTGGLATLFPSSVVVHRSRFEVDLNRPLASAVYRKPEDAWGLNLWHTDPADEHLEASLSMYRTFYQMVESLLRTMEQRHGHFLVLDLHSYNHRRDGADAEPASAEENPEINIGLSTINLDRWGPLVETFCKEFAAHGFDVRQNIKFTGGRFSRWVHETFPESGCSLAIEFKKTFMDEWTGLPDQGQLDRIAQALQDTVAKVEAKFWKQ